MTDETPTTPESPQRLSRRSFGKLTAAGAAAASLGLPLLSATSAQAAAPHSITPNAIPAEPGPITQPKYLTKGVNMAHTYVNPVALPFMEVATAGISQMPPTDAGIADSTALLPFLAKTSWTAADGRSMLRAGAAGFKQLGENYYRACADFTAVNYDGTVWLYCSGNLVDNRNIYSTRDYVNWQYHEMNVGVGAPTAVRIGSDYYMVGNGSDVYQAKKPQGPWTSIGKFIKRDGTTTTSSDNSFFLDPDTNRLYLSYSIGAPIMAVELDPKNPTKFISDPTVIIDFDPKAEWEHFGANKEAFTFEYMEGSQIFKVGRWYYLAVASGGTEHDTYTTGLFKSRKPLTGYQPVKNNPVGQGVGSNFPSSIYPNAGHGSFMLDADSNLVFFYTIGNGYEANLDRRFGFDVCSIDNNGDVTCTLSDTPQITPRYRKQGKSDDAGLYNLSTITQHYWASSYAPGRTPFYATDRSYSTWWEPADGDTAPEYIVGLTNPFHVSAVHLDWKELGTKFTKNNAVQYTVEYYDISANAWKILVDKSGNATPLPTDYNVVAKTLTHAIRVKILGTTEHVKVGIRKLNVFGEDYTLAASKGLLTLK